MGVVLATGSSADAGAEPVRIKGSNAANKLYVLGGRVGVATNLPGETATLAEVDVTGSSALCNLGAGVTWTNANVSSGGTLTTNSGSSGALSISSGSTATTRGTAAISTVNAGGTTYLNHRPASGAAIATLNLVSDGKCGFLAASFVGHGDDVESSEGRSAHCERRESGAFGGDESEFD